MNPLRSSLQFLTIIPLGRKSPFEARKMVAWFPIVGLILGIFLALVDIIATQFLHRHLVALVDVVFLIIITGGLHLDGLADTADGLFAHRSKERALEIMHDSRLGAMGAIALWVCLTLKWSALAHLPAPTWLYLVIVPAVARMAMMVCMAMLPCGRKQGTAKAAMQGGFTWQRFGGAIPVLLLSLCLGKSGLMLMAAAMLGTALLLWFYQRQVECVTGDMLGAACETMETWLWLWACVQPSVV